MRRFREEFRLKKVRILRECLIPIFQGLKIDINRQPLNFLKRYLYVLRLAIMSQLGNTFDVYSYIMIFLQLTEMFLRVLIIRRGKTNRNKNGKR